MGILQRLFRGANPTPEPTDVVHPVFGSIYMDTDSSWFAETIAPIGCGGSPSLSIDGDSDGPLPGSVDTYRHLREKWATVAPAIAETLLELNRNYYSDEPGKQLQTAEAIWETAELLSVCVGPDGDVSLTYIFNWQLPEDGHQVTVYLEDWVPNGTSIDG